MSGLESLLIKAKGAAKRGETEAARSLYRAVLDRHPRNARALAALQSLDGVGASARNGTGNTGTGSTGGGSTGGGSTAQLAFDRMVHAFRDGQLKDVVAIGRALARLHPAIHGVHNLLGAALLELGDDAGAEQAFRSAIAADPNPHASYNNLAIALRRQGKLAQAEDTYRAVMARAPRYADAPYNLANLFETLGRDEEAATAYAKAIAADPGHVDAHYNLGNLRAGQGRREEALAAFDAAIALRPGHSDAHNNRGGLLLAMDRADEALAAYERALAADPANAKALVNRGKALVMKGALPEAIASFRAAVALDPNDKSARLQALFEEAHICDWSTRGEYPLTEGPEAAAVQPFAALPFLDDPAHQYRRSLACAAQMYPALPAAAAEPPASPDGRIRVGYFSADFHDHATMHLMSGFFRAHDRARFDIRLYSYGPRREDDARRAELKAQADAFFEIGPLRDEEVVARARADALDIAVDLKGYTMGTRTRLFGHRLAPVQVSWMGYPGTLGHRCIDYFIADHMTMPPGAEAFFTEKIVRLSHCYQANDNRRAIVPDTRGRSGWGLPTDGFVFASFNQCYKIAPAEWDIWMGLLAEVPGSVLWLLRSNPWAEANLMREGEARSIDPARLVFAAPIPHAEHLGRLALADLFLDTFAVNAHTTASDALWAGLPVLTLTGRQFAARVASSLLHAVGLPELATATPADYAARALQLARQPDTLGRLRTRLAANRLTTPLFDTQAYTRRMERALAEMYRRQVEGLAPRHFDVD